MHRLQGIVVGALVGALVPLAAQAREQPPRPFGLGLMLGSPTGLAGKYYLGGGMALQMGLGVVDVDDDNDFADYDDDEDLQLHLEVVWHPAILTRNESFTLPFYVGVGGRMLDHDECYWFSPNRRWYCDDDTHVGVRVPFGILMDFHRVPLDVFLELAMVVDVLRIEDDLDDEFDGHDAVNLNAALGLRYYF